MSNICPWALREPITAGVDLTQINSKPQCILDIDMLQINED
jgi:hypothetical protein